MMQARRARRLLFAAAAVAAAVGFLPAGASGCSCARTDPRDWLAGGGVALIGSVVSERSEGRGSRYTVRVERGWGADLGGEVDIGGGGDETSCGFRWKVGERVAALLLRDGDGWRTNLCLLVEPDELEAATRPFPEPLGRGRVALLAAGAFGRSRLMALDRRGRILAYGRGGGETRQVSVCPGSRRVVELVTARSRARVVVRQLRTMDVLRALPAPFDATEVRCSTRTADSLLVASIGYRRGRVEARVLRGRDGRVSPLGRAPGDSVALGRRTAYVGGPNGVVAIGPAAGRVRPVAGPANATDLALSPGGRRLALLAPRRVEVLDLATGGVRSARVGRWGTPLWMGPRRLLVRVRGGRLALYDARLRRLDVVGPFRAYPPAVLGTRLVGVNGLELVELDVRRKRRRALTELPDRDVLDLVAVPGAPALVEASGRGFPSCRPGDIHPRVR